MKVDQDQTHFQNIEPIRKLAVPGSLELNVPHIKTMVCLLDTTAVEIAHSHALQR